MFFTINLNKFFVLFENKEAAPIGAALAFILL
jgi:hypothetical protein